MRLTKLIIDRAKYDAIGGRRFVLWDSQLSGFGVRVYPSGRKAFIFSYRLNGRKHLIAIGQYGPFTLQQARQKALELHLEVTEGSNPVEKRRRANSGDTIETLCHDYLERHAKTKKITWRDDQQRIKDFILPAWRKFQIKNITQSDVAALHHKIGHHSIYVANRTLAQISNMFEMAKKWGLLETGAANPARGIDKFKETKRNRWVTPEELPRLIAAIREEENLMARAALFLYLLTGARRSELLQLKWVDVDLIRKEICLRNTKAGNDHHLPLSIPAFEILRKIPRIDNNPYVFVGQIQGKHLVNITKPWNRIRKNAGIEDVHIHDLRRTVGSWLAQNNKSLHLIGRVLNHSNAKTTQIYAHFGQDNVRDALEEHGRLLLEAAPMEIKDVLQVGHEKS